MSATHGILQHSFLRTTNFIFDLQNNLIQFKNKSLKIKYIKLKKYIVTC